MFMSPSDPLFSGTPVAVPTATPAAATPHVSAFDRMMARQMADHASTETAQHAALQAPAEEAAPVTAAVPADTMTQEAPVAEAPAETAQATASEASDPAAPTIASSEPAELDAKATNARPAGRADAQTPGTKPAKDLSKASNNAQDDQALADAAAAMSVAVEVQPAVQVTAQPEVSAEAQALAVAAQTAVAVPVALASGHSQAENVAAETSTSDVKGRPSPSRHAPVLSKPAAPKLTAPSTTTPATTTPEGVGATEDEPLGKDVFAGLLDKASKGGRHAPVGEAQDTGAAGDGSQTTASALQTAEVDPKAAVAKAKSALEAFQAATQPASQADGAVVRSDAAAVQPQAATPAADASSSTAFSLQSLQDTSGSYNAVGASATAASNMSRTAVETLSALSMQINKRLSEGSTKFAIELHPADLGKVEVTLNIARDGKTTAHLRFDSPITAATFSSQEGELRQQLAQTGLTFDKDSLSFSSRSTDGGFGASLADQQGSQGQSQARAQQAARALQAAGKAAEEIDANAALDTALANFRNRSSQSLALNLIV